MLVVIDVFTPRTSPAYRANTCIERLYIAGLRMLAITLSTVLWDTACICTIELVIRAAFNLYGRSRLRFLFFIAAVAHKIAGISSVLSLRRNLQGITRENFAVSIAEDILAL
jgi:hypothetical protein